MKIVRNDFIPFKGYKAINLFGVLFCRRRAIIDEVTINHEEVHTAQMKEMLYVFYYLWYITEYLIKLVFFMSHKKAYRSIGFEAEAYINEENFDYLDERKLYQWMWYM